MSVRYLVLTLLQIKFKTRTARVKARRAMQIKAHLRNYCYRGKAINLD
jgi:hypothetical protein